MKRIKVSDLLKNDPNPVGYIAALLRSAADILEKSKIPDRLDSVAWRVADAGLDLRRLIESFGMLNVPGIHEETGKGALLPDSVKYPIPEYVKKFVERIKKEEQERLSALAAANAAYEEWNGPWSDELQCRLNGTYIDQENHAVYLRIGTGNCVDMGGAISMAERLCPGVLFVATFCRGERAGDLDTPDTAYQRKSVGEPWVVIPHEVMRSRITQEQLKEIMREAWKENC